MPRPKGSKNKIKKAPKPVSHLEYAADQQTTDWITASERYKAGIPKSFAQVPPPKTDEPRVERRRGFNAAEICYIIRVASKHNVTGLKIGDLSLSFARSQGHGDQPNRSSVDSVKPVAPGSNRAENVNALTDENQREIMEDIYSRQLMIDDPVAYEQLVMDDQEAGQRGERRQTEKVNRTQSAL